MKTFWDLTDVPLNDPKLLKLNVHFANWQDKQLPKAWTTSELLDEKLKTVTVRFQLLLTICQLSII